MNIGAVARKTGLPAKTIRYYEDIGLVRANRKPNGYRDYSEDQLNKLRFIARARQLGFSLDECRRLLSLQADPNRACSDVQELAATHVDDVEIQLRELEKIRSTLAELVDACKGGSKPDCPILDYLADENAA